ncbi:MAG: 5'/3'-nucleotidase SurE [Ardenticatenia bacterium]|nr:5'/3'-nucleotidase SurE [Ardenticatenia bacterium]
MKKLLLLTNDDGYTSPGLRALWPVLDEEFETIVVAPKRQRSWIGKAISNPGPLTLEQEVMDGKEVYVVDDGMPADCTNIGLYHVCPRKPDLVISGINPGPNFTSSLALASGTVGAALEAAENGVLGLAVSLNPDPSLFWQLEKKHEPEQMQYYEQAAEVVLAIAKYIFANPLPAEVKLINLVIPQVLAQPAKIVQCTPLPYEYGSVFIRKGNQFHNRTIGFIEEQADITPMSDVWVAQQGWVALTAHTGRLELCTDFEMGIEL